MKKIIKRFFWGALYLGGTLALSAQENMEIKRDSYGVPHIQATSIQKAYYLAGKVIAEDRPWQLEMTRRLARGKMSEVFGEKGLPSDKEILITGYTDTELKTQFERLSPLTQEILKNYAQGINDQMKAMASLDKLPPQFKQFQLQPTPWQVEDSIAICVLLARKFGNSGGPQLSNFSIYKEILKHQTPKDACAIMRDLLPQIDAKTQPIISKEEDLLKNNPPKFPNPSFAGSLAHLQSLPATSAEKLALAGSVAFGESTRTLAQEHSIIPKAGSYAIVIAGEHSQTGSPLLLGAPQMEHHTPSVVYEMKISTPEYSVAGITPPGIPAIVVGYTDHIAWTLTSGIGRTDDIFYSQKSGPESYLYGKEIRSLKKINHVLHVKGKGKEDFTTKRTHFGPVVFDEAEGGALYSKKSSSWMNEASMLDGLLELPTVKEGKSIKQILSKLPQSFNHFYALKNGEIGYHHAGKLPIRNLNLDPRYPTPGTPENEWKGFLPFESMPKLINPKNGILYDWNSQPVSWMPNLDRPTWSRFYRSNAINTNLNKILKRKSTKGKLAPTDLGQIACNIAQYDTDTSGCLMKNLRDCLNMKTVSEELTPKEQEAASYLLHFNGCTPDGSVAAEIYYKVYANIAEELLRPALGSAYDNPFFKQQLLHPMLVWSALSGKTEHNYLKGKTSKDIILKGIKAAVENASKQYGENISGWRFIDQGIKYAQIRRVPYYNRGTFIQIVDMNKSPSAYTVLGPGNTESGLHAMDQVDLVGSWSFKKSMLDSSNTSKDIAFLQRTNYRILKYFEEN